MITTAPLATPEQSAEAAETWLADNPLAKRRCPSCREEYPLAASRSLTCPACGRLPAAELCLGLIDGYHKRAIVKAPPLSAEAVAPPRCDPPGLADVIGNPSAVLQIRTFLDAHKEWLKDNPKLPFPHTLLSGSGGLGKTMLAEIISREVGSPFHLEMGQSLNSPARIGDVLRSLKAGDILFIDECHGLKAPCQEALYRAMEDGLFVPIQKAGSPVLPPCRLPPFTLIGSTTDAHGLLPSFGQRFKYHVKLKRLLPGELADAMLQRAARKGWQLDAEAAGVIGARAHGTPRLAIRLLDGCMDVAKAGGENKIDAFIVARTCEILEVDALGLDDEARRYLTFLAEGKGPVRLNVLATRLDGLSRRTVETRVEPDLVWLGLIEKSANGRCLTEAGRAHLRKGE